MHDVHGVMYDCIDAGTDVCRGVGVARELGTGGERGARLNQERKRRRETLGNKTRLPTVRAARFGLDG